MSGVTSLIVLSVVGTIAAIFAAYCARQAVGKYIGFNPGELFLDDKPELDEGHASTRSP